ncbi:MAG: tetratricopeptide repeat protein [Acidobacteria bacterium]|nr:tetratricopeptide repeat protein [Acidobacteriota bacterium]MYA47484.1 tetratricopeptide repeat protein [Acidobacteriota bacterium]MYI37987.1 tetratricopeptide repeat protein [Acidobacteriota bacterium]
MNQLSERALFFGAGLAFGILVGFLVSGSSGPPAPAAPPPAPVPETASAPLPEPRPVDPEALQTLLAAVEATPEDPAARAAVGDLHLDALDFGQAVYWFQQARNLDPSDLDVRSRLAFAQLGAGDVAGAVAGYEAVLAEDPEHFESLVALGRVRLFVEQDLAAGIELWERAIAARPDSPEAAALRAQIESLRTAHP